MNRPMSANMNTLGLLLFFVALIKFGSAEHAMRSAKCIIPDDIEESARADFYKDCIAKNYAGKGDGDLCYDELGCFPMASPWTSILRPFPPPIHPAEINVHLYCYTRDSPRRFNVTLWPIDLDNCNIKGSRKTVFITHGFASDGNFPWMSEMKDNYLAEEDANVFLVDWGKGAQLLNYLQVASNTRIVGAELVRFINFLQKKHGLKPAQLHLIGHSLGAHISAYVAKGIPGVKRLTALDPAQPGFEAEHKKVRLDRDDALFVDAIHTNAAPFIPALGFGMMEPCGHVDIYINGAMHQPGCILPNVTGIKGIKDLGKIPVEVIGMWVCCSHCRAFDYFKHAIKKDCRIWGYMTTFAGHLLNVGSMGLLSKMTKCDADSCTAVGLDTPDFKARGVFAATTHLSPPFCETDPAKNKKIMDQIQAKPGKGVFQGVLDSVKDAADTAAGKLGDKLKKIEL